MLVSLLTTLRVRQGLEADLPFGARLPTRAGGTIGILALNGLFTLMQKHNLYAPKSCHWLAPSLARSHS